MSVLQKALDGAKGGEDKGEARGEGECEKRQYSIAVLSLELFLLSIGHKGPHPLEPELMDLWHG